MGYKDSRKTIERHCNKCSSMYDAVISELKRGKGKYCSLRCAAAVGREVFKTIVEPVPAIEALEKDHICSMALDDLCESGEVERRMPFGETIWRYRVSPWDDEPTHDGPWWLRTKDYGDKLCDIVTRGQTLCYFLTGERDPIPPTSHWLTHAQWQPVPKPVE